MYPLRLAPSYDESEDRRHLYAQWADDADRYAAGIASSRSSGGIHYLLHGGPRGSNEGSVADVGNL